jgi:hypothetical protein
MMLSPHSSPLDASSYDFPIFHLENSKNTRSAYPFALRPKAYLRPGEAVCSLERMQARHQLISFSLPPSSSVQEFSPAMIPIQQPALVQTSPSSNSSQSPVLVKPTLKKQCVDPNLYSFTTESSRITLPEKFDRAVMSFLQHVVGKPVSKMPSVDKKWLSFWSLFHGNYFFIYIHASCS